VKRLLSPLAAVIATGLVTGCAGAPPPPKKEPLGAMPTAVTSAQPEWISTAPDGNAPPAKR
jgi:hypothetical protein